MRRYEFFDKIEDDSLLAKKLNGIMSNMTLMRISAAPVRFGKHAEGSEYLFYLTCLFEGWCHKVVERLHTWVDSVNEYLGEYEGHWEYYAQVKRLDAVREGWLDEDEDMSEGDLKNFGVISHMYFEDWNDLVQDTNPEDLEWIRSVLRIDAENDLGDVFKKAMNVDIQMFMMDEDEDGNRHAVPMSREDRDLKKISEMVSADDDSQFVLMLCKNMRDICDRLKKMEESDDNKDTLAEIGHMAEHLLELK